MTHVLIIVLCVVAAYLLLCKTMPKELRLALNRCYSSAVMYGIIEFKASGKLPPEPDPDDLAPLQRIDKRARKMVQELVPAIRELTPEEITEISYSATNEHLKLSPRKFDMFIRAALGEKLCQ